jgi:hypothetical protein
MDVVISSIKRALSWILGWKSPDLPTKEEASSAPSVRREKNGKPGGLRPMGDIFKLIDVCCEIFDNPAYAPRDGVTYCNQAVQDIAEKLGYKGFTPTMNANAMIQHMASSPDFMEIHMEIAQRMANSGELVIACQEDNPHGHVVVVRPGCEVFSSKWQKSVPKVVNIGAKNMIGQGLNWVFPSVPRFYTWQRV